MKPGTGAKGAAAVGALILALGENLPEAGTPGDLLHKSGQAEVPGRAHSLAWAFHITSFCIMNGAHST